MQCDAAGTIKEGADREEVADFRYVYYHTHDEVNMRTNIVLNDELVAEAFQCAKDIHTKKELVEVALQEFIRNRRIKDIRDLRGRIEFADGYDYKAMRTN